MLSARCQSISRMKVRFISRVDNKRTIDKGNCKSLLVKLRLTHTSRLNSHQREESFHPARAHRAPEVRVWRPKTQKSPRKGIDGECFLHDLPARHGNELCSQLGFLLVWWHRHRKLNSFSLTTVCKPAQQPLTFERLTASKACLGIVSSPVASCGLVTCTAAVISPVHSPAQ